MGAPEAGSDGRDSCVVPVTRTAATAGLGTRFPRPPALLVILRPEPPAPTIVTASLGYLIAAGVYLAALLPWLITETGSHPHPRVYLLELQYASPAHLAADVVANVAVFAPLGWLLARSLASRLAAMPVGVLVVGGLGGGLSLVVETLQFFLTSRYSSLIDVLANTLGAVAGAVVARRRL